MDSTTLLWWMKSRVQTIHTVSVDYGQRHFIELDSARELSAAAHASSHRVLSLNLGQFGGNPLTEEGLEVPAAADQEQVRTVVPFRNMLFVTLAAAWAESEGIANLFISPVKDDFEAYRDCRRSFYDALQTALSLGSSEEGNIRVHTPFVDRWKREVIATGLELGVPYALTHTCYEGDRNSKHDWGFGCGRCPACELRADGYADFLAKEKLS